VEGKVKIWRRKDGIAELFGQADTRQIRLHPDRDNGCYHYPWHLGGADSAPFYGEARKGKEGKSSIAN
jgi:hypothetical protein